MAKLNWKPWHQVVELRDDVKTGEISQATFAADLYKVAMGDARSMYQDPHEFFSLTYPTHNLRELARKVLRTLAGKADKSVLQLKLTYGGGKTHTLITLYHLVTNADSLPDLPSVAEFRSHIDIDPTEARSRVVVLPFDKLDVEKGMNVIDPQGNERWLKHPWSVMAYQIAGDEGLKLIHADGKAEERVSPPAQNVLEELLSLPSRDGLGTLILLDEVMMFARVAYDYDQSWASKLTNFFQYLTQAVECVERCALVASLLASDTKLDDETGKKIRGDFENVFRRKQEPEIQPVEKHDVAELLRRRFFKPESIQNKGSFKTQVIAAMKGLAAIDDQIKKTQAAEEERFTDSYPFHPELTELLYTKWVQLETFQRARGILRVFALALRDASKWDNSPLVDVASFLPAPGEDGLSEALKEMTHTAETEEYEGKRQDWGAILKGELKKAQDAQEEHKSLEFREAEQAVVAVFLHSQPIGQKASSREVLIMLGDTNPDRIELTKALRHWAKGSWFLDEAEMGDEFMTGSSAELPKNWRLGSKPNLKQIHHDAIQRITDAQVNFELKEAIEKTNKLISGASAAGARPHLLPNDPSDVDDNGEFHYVVLGIKAASEPGKPSAEARRFIEETTSADRPRVHRNAILIAVPSKDGLEAARQAIRVQLGWREVESLIADQKIEESRKVTLKKNISETSSKIPIVVLQAYTIVVTVDKDNDIKAFRINHSGVQPLFDVIKAAEKSRIQEQAVSAEALLPGGPYELWHEGDTAKRVKDLVGAFSQFPHLPKMLKTRDIRDTLAQGVERGFFVLKLTRPDKTVRTYWFERPSDEVMKDASLELVIPEAAELTAIPYNLLTPKKLEALWSEDSLTVAQVMQFFSGEHIIDIDFEKIRVPKASSKAIYEAVGEAVASGRLWLVSGEVSLLAEEVPEGIISDDSVIQAPPAPIPPTEIMDSTLSAAWKGNTATARAITLALEKKLGTKLPWITVKNAISGAINARVLVKDEACSASWPCDFGLAEQVILNMPKDAPPLPSTGVKTTSLVKMTSGEIQDLADSVGKLAEGAGAAGIEFEVRITVGKNRAVKDDEVAKLNADLLDINKELNLS